MNTGKTMIVILFQAILSFHCACVNADESKGLIMQARQMFGPLPAAMESDNNPITAEKAQLGKMLFYESRISVDGTVSCARCHPLGLYGADGLEKSIGNNCKINPRNAPTILNAASQIAAHWIGNRTGVEDQALRSLTGPPSFGMPSNRAVEERLVRLGYAKLFAAAFPGEKNPVTAENFAKAVGAFERTLVTPAPIDAYVQGDAGALSPEQKRGLRIFIDAGCGSCHGGAYFGGRMYQKFGITAPYWKFTKSKTVDAGRFEVTKHGEDKYVFKVPILRNVGKTPPYFHDGSVDDLAEAVRIMGRVQMDMVLADAQVKDLVAFLSSLTGVISPRDLTVPLLP